MTVQIGIGGAGRTPRPPAPRPAPRPAYHPPPPQVTLLRGRSQAPYRPPAPPAPSHFLGAVGGAIRHAAPAVHNAVQQATTPHQAGAGPHNAFTRTPQYRQAVAQVFHEQPPAAKAAIIRGITRANAFNSPEYQAIRPQWDHLSLPERSAISSLIPHDLPKFIAPKPGPNIFGEVGKGISSGLGDISGLLDKVHGLGGNTTANRIAQASGVPTPGNLGKLAYHVPIDVARATSEDLGVIPKTLKGAADSTVGMVAGAVQLPIRAIQEGPGKAVSQLAGQAAADYKRRYGPLLHGNDRAFINRIKKEGAAPEAFDALAVAGGLDATAGRAVSTLSKAKAALSGEDNVLTRPRPDLLLSGRKSRPQTLSPTAGRAVAQRLEDAMRRRHAAKGELMPNTRQVAPIFQSHAIRVTHSGIAQRWRRVVQENLNREVRGRPGSALANIGKLNHWQKQAAYHAIHGIRVDTAEHFRADLGQRVHQIEQDRLNPKSLGNRIPAQHADKVDELRLIDRLIPQADKIVGPKMVAFQKAEAERAQRIEATTALHPATAEARRLRPIGERLGIEHPDVAVARRVEQLHKQQDALRAVEQNPASLDELRTARSGLEDTQRELDQLQNATVRPQRLAAYSAKVRAEMGKQGLPEPGYFLHQKRPDVKYGDFTAGQGGRAMPADKLSKFALHRAGVADTSAQAYIQGLARSVKRPLQWRLTDEQFRAAALPTVSRDEVKAALGHNKAPNLLTGDELQTVLEHQGVDMHKVAFYNPGRLAESTLADHELLPQGHKVAEGHDLASEEIHHALNQDEHVQLGDHPRSERFLTTTGWKVVPRTALDEIQGNVKASSLLGRSVGKVQGLSAAAILGQNPHFLIMNTLAHAIPAVAGTKGRILGDLAKFPVWWHGLSDTERDTVRGFSGGRGGHFATTARLGSQAPNQIASFGRRLDEQGLVQAAKHVNPFHAILKGEDLQSNFFRHAVMYHEMKRQAFQDMGHEYGRAVAQWEQVKNIFGIKDPQERMRAIMNNQTKMEELGRTTVNILGDYGRFTNRERQFLNNRAVLFYSFMRHVTRTLLYVLPVRHPLAMGLMQELGNLHVEEVKKLMGGQDLPWAYGRMFFGKSNKLRSIDLTSTSPISSPLVDVLSGGVKQLPRLVSPALAPLLDVAYGQTPTKQPVQQNAWTYLNDLLSLSYPYRAGAAAHFGLRTQQSDSVPVIHERAKAYKYKKNGQPTQATAYTQAKEHARGPLKDYLLGTTLGVYPKPDDSRVIAEHMAKLGKGKHGRPKSPFPRGGGGGSFGGGGFSGGFGGGFGGGQP